MVQPIAANTQLVAMHAEMIFECMKFSRLWVDSLVWNLRPSSRKFACYVMRDISRAVVLQLVVADYVRGAAGNALRLWLRC